MRPKLSNFYIRSGLFVGISVFAALFNYALYPTLGHILGTVGFGNFTVLSALSNQALGILLAFNLVSIYLVKSQPETVARHYTQAVQKALIIFFMIMSASLLILMPVLNTKLKIQDPIGFLLVTLILLASIPGVVWSGYLQGHKKIVIVGTFSLSSAVAKLFSSAVLAVFFGVRGALLGVLLGSLVGLAVMHKASPLCLPSLSSIFHRFDTEQTVFLRSMRRYLIGSTIIVGGLTVLQNIDISYAKYLFPPDLAGQYAGISILSNAIYLSFFMLFWIIVPEFEVDQPKVNYRVLKTTYKLILLLGLLAVAVTALCHQLIISLLLGSNFTQLSSLLVLTVTYQIMLVSVTLYAYYLLVIRNRQSLILAICTVVPSLSLPLLAQTPTQLIAYLNISLAAGVVLFGLTSLLLRARKRYAEATH